MSLTNLALRQQSVFSASTRPPVARTRLQICFSKGFGADAKVAETAEQASSASSEDSSVEALEAQIRGKRNKKGKVEPKVKVNAPVVDAVTGKAPATPATQGETAAVAALFFLFSVIIVEGLLLAGAGFLPEEVDAFIQDELYPSYSPTVLVFLAGSTLYGLFKVGKLPGQRQL